MASSYETITVLTDLQAAGVSRLHCTLLQSIDFGIEDAGNDTLYLYPEEANSMPELHDVEDHYPFAWKNLHVTTADDGKKNAHLSLK